MSSNNDLEELLKVAKNIDDGEYSIDEIKINPNSELFEIASYLKNALSKLYDVNNILDAPSEDLPLFDKILTGISEQNKKVTNSLIELVNKLNFNIDSVKNNLALMKNDINAENKLSFIALLEKNKETAMEGQNICYDIISSLGYHDVIKNNTNKLITIIKNIDKKLIIALAKLGVQDNTINFETYSKINNKEYLENQDLVDELLKEFGL